MIARPVLLLLTLLVSAGASPAAEPARVHPPEGRAESAPRLVVPSVPEREAEAERLLARAEGLLARRQIDTRRMAITDLERACQLAPLRVDMQITLARAYYEAGFLKQAKRRFERAVAVAPNDADARFGLGQAWRRDWLKYLEPRSLDRAVEHYTACGRLDSTRADAWLLVAALQIERHDLAAAREAAERALRADHGRADCLLGAASVHWRRGDVGGADSLFRVSFTRLRRSVRERFEDFAPLASESDTMTFNRLPVRERAEFVRRFWSENDPDLATPENEAQLEYWSRVAQAYFLFYDPSRREWDQRGEIYVRYGPPDSVTYNPVGTSLYGYRGGGNQVAFPINVLVWSYPQLGMSVVMNDRMLSERYELPLSMDRDMDPTPEPDSLERLGVMATRSLRGVFPALPPGARALDVASQLARFEAPGGGSLLFAGVSAPGGPSDTLAADLVVLDSTLHERIRERSTLSPSACDAAGLRVAEFQQPLPPGDYTVGVSVRGQGRRGARRTALHVEAADSALDVSDLVVTCGVPAGFSNTVQLDANPSGRVPAGQPLVAYFEVYHLAQGSDGQGRFEYETTVRSAQRDTRMWLQRWLSPRREGQDLGVTRQDAVLGTVRRQFVSIPIGSLNPGRYRLDVVVRDVLTGDEIRRSAEFTREPDAR